MKYEKVKNPKTVCSVGGPAFTTLHKEGSLHVGFGVSQLRIDDCIIAGGRDIQDLTVAELEEKYNDEIQSAECALLEFYGGLSSEKYEYDKADGNWYLVKQERGFA